MDETPKEIERKFLVAELPDLDTAEPAAIRQGYLTRPGDSVQVRLRQKGARYFLTVKGKGGLVRSEHETEIRREVFETLWPATGDRRVEKTRWTGNLEDGHVFELDLFDDRELSLVEVEFDSRSAAQDFSPPEWFGTDVTGNPAYANSTLASQDPSQAPAGGVLPGNTAGKSAAEIYVLEQRRGRSGS